MTIVIAVAIAVIAGAPIVIAIDRRVDVLELCGLAYLYGTGIIYFVMLIMQIAGVRWTAISVTVGVGLVAGSVGYVSLSTARLSLPKVSHDLKPIAIDALTLFTVAGYALYATLASVWQWDFWMIWGLKAAQFFESAAIDWQFLQSPWNGFSHPDYPLLLPLNYTYIALLHGSWDDRWLGIVSVAYGAALILIVRRLASREASPIAASSVAFASTAFALTAHVGMAEAPLIAFASAAVLYLRRHVLFGDDAALRHGVALLGLAANCKNEGLALAAAVALACLVLKPRLVVRLIPAALMILPWTILRAVHNLTTDFLQGPFISRFIERSAAMPAIAAMLFLHIQDRVMWLLIAAGLLVVPATWRRKERLVLVVTAIQIVFFVVVYLGTPMDVRTHIETSWPRLPRQIAIPILFVDLISLAQFICAGTAPEAVPASSTSVPAPL